VASTADKPSKKPTAVSASSRRSSGAPAAKGKAPAKVAAKEPAKPRVSRQRSPTQAAIAKRAYELSLADDGGGGGNELSHWLQAERELTKS
jgi:hypothetical protein